MKRHFIVGVLLLLALLLAGDVPASSPLVITARLVKIVDAPDCGGFHFGSVALYDDIRVISGSYAKSRIQVIHGCTELSRQEYGIEAGNLYEFRVGDRHRMRLVSASEFQGPVVEAKRMKPADRYLCAHVTLDTKNAPDPTPAG